MSEQSDKWDAQWSTLLTHCYGEVEADAGFKASLLAKLRTKTAENRGATDESDAANDENWSRLLTAAYVPCEPSSEFKGTLFSQLKARQTQLTKGPQSPAEEEALQTILTKSYHPVTPRREFQTRLLENLKERQRTNTTIRVKSRRRTVFMSAMTSMAAAAMVMFAVWVMPTIQQPGTSETASHYLALEVPEADSFQEVAQTSFASGNAYADIVPASYEPSAPSFNYNALEAFAAAALPAVALGRKNIEINSGGEWKPMDTGYPAELEPGMAFRAPKGKVGFIGFDDDTILSLDPGTVIEATESGIAVRQGFAKVSVPETSDQRFRLHFAERDIAIEPGTDLAVYVEPNMDFAEGGAPAPVVMVLQEPGAVGGLAFAKGKNGVAPLFARHLYRLDNYVTQDIPGRPLCEIECEGLEKMYKTQSVQEAEIPMAAFAGAGSIARSRIQRNSERIVTPVGFTKRSDRWVADTYANQHTVKVQYLSDAYFGLARERRDLAPGLALGSNVIIDGGDDVFYEISK